MEERCEELEQLIIDFDALGNQYVTLRIEVRKTLGREYIKEGSFDAAQEIFQEALELHETHVGPDAILMNELAVCLMYSQNTDSWRLALGLLWCACQVENIIAIRSNLVVAEALVMRADKVVNSVSM